MYPVFLLHVLLTLLHPTTGIPAVQPKIRDLESGQIPCATNKKSTEYMKDVVKQGFCKTIWNRDPGGAPDDIIALDFDFDFGTNICGYHVYWDISCNICARSTINRTSVNVGHDGIACLRQHDNGGWWKSIQAATCDGTGVGCWNGGMMEVEHPQSSGPERGSGYGTGQDHGCDSGHGYEEQESEHSSGHDSEQDSEQGSEEDYEEDPELVPGESPVHSPVHSSETGSDCGS